MVVRGEGSENMLHNGKNTAGVLSRNLVNEDVLTHWGLSRHKQTNQQTNSKIYKIIIWKFRRQPYLKKNCKSSDMWHSATDLFFEKSATLQKTCTFRNTIVTTTTAKYILI
jgi:hypothetical protein